MTAPDFKVEIAFNAGYSTAAGSRTWTDVTAYLDGGDAGIIFGRGDERSNAEANSVSLALVNTDGRFTPAKASGAYYPNVKVGRPIRITSTPSGQPASVRFLGYIDSWRVQWPGGGESYATTEVSANSRMARLGLNTALRSIVEEEYLRDSPIAYYTLGEAQGATFASDTSGVGTERLVPTGAGTSVVFGSATGPGTDGLTAATFAGGGSQYLQAIVNVPASAVMLEGFLSTTASPASDSQFLMLINDDGSKYLLLAVDTFGRVKGVRNGSSLGVSAPYNDGATRHVALILAAGTAALYVAGALEATIASAGNDAYTTLVLGRDLACSLAHVAVSANTSATRVASHATAGLTGFADETPADRLTRYASYAGIPAAEVSAETGSTLMAHIDTTGLGVLDAMRKVEETEGGVLFDARDGTLTFHDRAHRYGTAAALTLDASQQKLGGDYAPDLDRSALVNTSSAQNGDGTEVATAVNQTSVDDYGLHSRDFTLYTTVDEEPFQRAWWTVNTSSDPDDRVPTLTVDLEGLTAAEQTTVLNLTIGSRIDVTNLPTQAASTSASYFVEGATESIGPGTHKITFNVSPGEKYLNVWTVEDAVLGQYDAYGLAY